MQEHRRLLAQLDFHHLKGGKNKTLSSVRQFAYPPISLVQDPGTINASAACSLSVPSMYAKVQTGSGACLGIGVYLQCFLESTGQVRTHDVFPSPGQRRLELIVSHQHGL